MFDHKILKNIIMGMLVLTCLLTGSSIWASWDYSYDTAWMDDFNQGVPGTQPSQWKDISNGGRAVELAYSYHDSYAAITRSVIGDGWGDIFSEDIYCNVDIYDTLEIRVVDSFSTSVTSWSIGLQENTGDHRYYELHAQTGATGTFSFQIRDITSWSGNQNFKIRILVQGNIGEYLLIDYVSVFRNSTDRKNFWREDFVGDPNTQIRAWWDESEDETLNAEIYYSDSSFQSNGNIKLVDTSGNSVAPWGKVLSPGIIWDMDVYNHVAMQITSVAPGTTWQLWVREIGGSWQGVSMTARSVQTGAFIFDIQNVPGWIWSGPTFMAFELYVEGSTVGASYDIDYIQVYRPQDTPTPVLITPSPTPTISPTIAVFPNGCYVTPNPFLPKRGEKAFFNFQMPGTDQHAVIRIMDIKGRIVKTINSVNEWDGKDNQGRLCEPGIYIYQIEGLNQRMSGKLVIIY